MINPSEHIEKCCTLAIDVLDGRYGWFSETITLVCFIVVVNIFVYFVIKRLHLHYSTHKKYWQDSFVRALYKPLIYFVWFIALITCFDLVALRISGENFFLEHHIHMFVGVGSIFSPRMVFAALEKICHSIHGYKKRSNGNCHGSGQNRHDWKIGYAFDYFLHCFPPNGSFRKECQHFDCIWRC